MRKIIEKIIADHDGFAVLKAVNPTLSYELRARFVAADAAMKNPSATVVFAGSFSSGKSSLINAILEQKVLPTGNRPVTSSPVLCQEASSTSVMMATGTPRKGWQRQQVQQTPLHKQVLATQQTLENNGAWIQLGLKEWPLSSNLKVLDSPGFNSEDEQHLAMARAAMHAAHVVVVVAGERGLTHSDKEFLRETKLSQSKHIGFVLNKMDIIDEREELEEMVELARENLNEMGWNNAPVLVCSAKGEVNKDTGLNGWESVRQWLQTLAEHHVEDVVTKQANDTLQKALIHTGADIHDEQKQLQQLIGVLNKKLSSEHRSQIDAFEERVCKELLDALHADHAQHIDKFINTVDNATAAVVKWLNNPNTDNTNEHAVNKMLRKQIGKIYNAIGPAVNAFRSKGKKSIIHALSQLDKEIQRNWADLQLQNRSQSGKLEKKTRLSRGQPKIPKLDITAIDDSVAGTLGGAAVGAMLGSFVPGVGTIIGSLIGGAVSWLFSDQQAKAWDAIAEAYDEKRDELIDLFDTQFEESMTQLIAFADEQLDEQIAQYLQALDQQKRIAEADLASVQEKNETLVSARKTLQGWSKKLNA